MPVKNDFEKLPEKVQERIVMRNHYSDAMIEPIRDIEKADFLVQMIQENYTQHIDDEESLKRWKYEKPRIEILIEMIRDYTIKVRDSLQKLDKQLDKENEIDRGGE